MGRFILAGITIAMFLFGVAASAVVPFGAAGVTVIDAARHVIASGASVSIVDAEVIGAIAIALTLCVVYAGIWKMRPGLAAVTSAVSALLPLGILVFLAGIKGLAMWVIAFIYGPALTAGLFIGLDGETWSDGMVAVAAASWWSILWLVVFACDARRANRRR